MHDHAIRTRRAVSTASNQIRQAIFTWRKLRPGKEGYGFAAVSPGLKGQLEWLEASTETLTGFVGSSRPTSEQREAFKPVGRHVSGGTALVYRKEDAGLDGHDRPGNYIVHFLVAPVKCLSLSDALRVPETLWVDEALGRLNPNIQMDDITLSDFRDILGPPYAVEVDDPNSVLDALYKLVQEGRVSVADWSRAEILALLSVMPIWADYAANLVPAWSDDGPKQSLELASISPHVVTDIDDRRCAPSNPDLYHLGQRLLYAADMTEIRSLLKPVQSLSDESQRRFAEAQQLATSQVASEHNTGPALETSVRKWVTVGVQELTPAEKLSLLEKPSDVLQILERINQQLPSARKPDPLALSLLERCGEVAPSLLARTLPIEDGAVAMYIALCHSDALLEAAILLNSDRSRTIDLTFQSSVPAATVQHIIQRSRDDADVYRGLIRSLQISSLGAGSFAKRMLLAKGIDFEYVYSDLLPAASAGRDDALLSLACINPDAFVTYLRVPEPYGGAVVNVFRQETRQRAWERISRFAGRWRKH